MCVNGMQEGYIPINYIGYRLRLELAYKVVLRIIIEVGRACIG
jgi:hypothetical protein